MFKVVVKGWNFHWVDRIEKIIGTRWISVCKQLTIVVHCFCSAIRKLVQTSLYRTFYSIFLNSGLVESPEGCAEKKCGFSFTLGFPLLEGGEIGKALQYTYMSVTCVGDETSRKIKTLRVGVEMERW